MTEREPLTIEEHALLIGWIAAYPAGSDPGSWFSCYELSESPVAYVALEKKREYG